MILVDVYRKDREGQDIPVAKCKSENWVEVGLLGELLTQNGYYYVIGKVKVPVPPQEVPLPEVNP